MVDKKTKEISDELTALIQKLKESDRKIDEISKQQVLLKHEYRSTRDKVFKEEIMKKWNNLQKKMETLEKKRRKIIEKKNEINFKRKWKGWK